MNENRPYLSVIFPIAGAADYLPLSLIDADRRLREYGRDYEIIVVGCGLSENPPEAVRKIASVIGLRLVDVDSGKRWIDAVRHGLCVAAGRYSLLCTSGDEVQTAELLKLPEFLEKNPEAGIVLGKRSLRSDPRKLFYSGVYKFLIPELSDPSSPFVCLTAASAETLINRDFSGDSVIHFMLTARKAGIKLAEVPVSLTGNSQKIGIGVAAAEIYRNIKIRSGNIFERFLGIVGNLLDKVSKKYLDRQPAEGGKDQR